MFNEKKSLASGLGVQCPGTVWECSWKAPRVRRSLQVRHQRAANAQPAVPAPVAPAILGSIEGSGAGASLRVSVDPGGLGSPVHFLQVNARCAVRGFTPQNRPSRVIRINTLGKCCLTQATDQLVNHVKTKQNESV